ncbi:MAG TPA: GGDEF domain-containing protein [Firmicutes bacterium]|nr:GGDEF domain-containing protein [Bacillota bacterium]
MFYNYARLVFTVFGLGIGFTGYYLDMVLQVGYEGWIWLATTFILSLGGFAAGGLIQRLSASSLTDFLTGLYNRRFFYLRLDEEEARASRKKKPLCIAMIDVDDFKAVNDTYGHVQGDLLLCELAGILKNNTRFTDIVARWGGDEFAIIFSETPLPNACEIMERIRSKVEQAFSPYELTISAGIMTLEPEQNLKDLLIMADQALYEAKARKNSVTAVAVF